MLSENEYISILTPLISYHSPIITIDFEYSLSMFFAYYGRENFVIITDENRHLITAHDYKIQNSARDLLYNLIISQRCFYVLSSSNIILLQCRRLDERPKQ